MPHHIGCATDSEAVELASPAYVPALSTEGLAPDTCTSQTDTLRYMTVKETMIFSLCFAPGNTEIEAGTLYCTRLAKQMRPNLWQSCESWRVKAVKCVCTGPVKLRVSVLYRHSLFENLKDEERQRES